MWPPWGDTRGIHVVMLWQVESWRPSSLFQSALISQSPKHCAWLSEWAKQIISLPCIFRWCVQNCPLAWLHMQQAQLGRGVLVSGEQPNCLASAAYHPLSQSERITVAVCNKPGPSGYLALSHAELTTWLHASKYS